MNVMRLVMVVAGVFVCGAGHGAWERFQDVRFGSTPEKPPVKGWVDVRDDKASFPVMKYRYTDKNRLWHIYRVTRPLTADYERIVVAVRAVKAMLEKECQVELKPMSSFVPKRFSDEERKKWSQGTSYMYRDNDRIAEVHILFAGSADGKVSIVYSVSDLEIFQQDRMPKGGEVPDKMQRK